MTISGLVNLVDKRYRSIVVVLFAFGGCAWAVVGAIGKFTDMVDQRALRVVESFSAKPLAEHKDFERRISQQEKDIAGLIQGAQLMHDNLLKLMAVYEEQDKMRRGIPVQLSGPVRP